MNLFDGVGMEVTVTSTRMVTFLGEPVIVKLFTVFVELIDVLKKGVDPATSGLAITSIFTPPLGIVDLMVTVRGKSGPGAGAWLLPEAGFNSTTKAGSGVPPPPPLLQLPLQSTTEKAIRYVRYRTFFILSN